MCVEQPSITPRQAYTTTTHTKKKLESVPLRPKLSRVALARKAHFEINEEKNVKPTASPEDEEPHPLKRTHKFRLNKVQSENHLRHIPNKATLFQRIPIDDPTFLKRLSPISTFDEKSYQLLATIHIAGTTLMEEVALTKITDKTQHSHTVQVPEWLVKKPGLQNALELQIFLRFQFCVLFCVISQKMKKNADFARVSKV